MSFNKQAGTLRGMHYQAEPYGQAKLGALHARLNL
jgi:dTDP-4-dehydrorhamnose 3,5-epimerase-like enzyme